MFGLVFMAIIGQVGSVVSLYFFFWGGGRGFALFIPTQCGRFSFLVQCIKSGIEMAVLYCLALLTHQE